MSWLFPLSIFPEGALSHSVITTVWVGVFVVAYFNLRLGWTLSGLVIPGYMVPLMIAKPWAALTVLIEAILTYLIVRFLSTALSKWGKANNLFGRDRFFALILCSLVVRIVLDGWALPLMGQWLQNGLGITFDYSGHMRSFGLIITALIANYFWKPGLRSGLYSISVITGITFILVRFVLMEYTNFNIGRIEYMFEDMVTFFLASPKAYIIIIVTSLMASRMNVEYGWEYSGIIIPSLLALQWYQPLKLVATLVEAMVILALASLVMKLPIFRNITIEGARKILLFFNISFIYKFLLGHILLLTAPHVHISDFYGFGYLLSTMIAVKMHQRDILPQMTRSLFQTSLSAVAAASIVGFLLTFLSQIITPTAPLSKPTTFTPRDLNTSLVETLRQEKLLLFQNRAPGTVRLPSPPELDTFAQALRLLMSYTLTHNKKELDAAVYFLTSINYRLDLLQQRYLLLREKPPYRGGGIYIFDLQNTIQTPPTTMTEALVVEIPSPIDEWLVLETGTRLFKDLNGSAMAIAGTSRRYGWDQSTDVLINSQTFFHTFHRIVGHNNVLQVRTHTVETLRLLEGVRKKSTSPKTNRGEISLWVKSRFPEGLSLSQLNQLLGQYTIHWDEPPFKNIQRSHSRTGFAELFLNRTATRKSMIKAMVEGSTTTPKTFLQHIDGHLPEWLLIQKKEIAPKNSNRYRAMTLAELLFFDQEILSPLLAVIQNQYAGGKLTSDGLDEMQAIDAAASLLGYRLYWYHHLTSKQDYIILAEQEPYKSPSRRFSGIYVFHLGISNPYIVEIPRPLLEQNSLEYGISLFQRLNARALLLAGSHPFANSDHSSDPIHISNKTSLFNLVNQVILRDYMNQSLMVVACRAYSIAPAQKPSADVFISFGDSVYQPETLTPTAKLLWDSLENDGLKVEPADGSAETCGYEVGMIAQYRYLEQTKHKEFAVLWLSPGLREHFRGQIENRLEESQFISLGIPSVTVDLMDYLRQNIKTNTTLPEELKNQVETYVIYKDIILLQHLLESPVGKSFTWIRLLDRNSQESYLAMLSPVSGLVAITNLSPRLPSTVQLDFLAIDSKQVQYYISSRGQWLIASNLKKNGPLQKPTVTQNQNTK